VKGRGPWSGTVVLLASWTVLALGLGLVRERFISYAVVPLALATALVVRAVAARLPPGVAPRARGAGVLAGLLVSAGPALPALRHATRIELGFGAADRIALLSWLGTQPLSPRRPAVMGMWADGHDIQWFARRPVIATPFGSDIDARSLAGEVAFITEPDPAVARAVLDERQVGLLLLRGPGYDIAQLGELSPRPERWSIERRSISTGRTFELSEGLLDLVVNRLYYLDGGSRDRAPVLADYRLVAESANLDGPPGAGVARYKLFEVVDGAIVEVPGLAPGVSAQCSTRITTNTGRAFGWVQSATAGADGTARFRVPYATGPNGAVRAEPYAVEAPGWRGTVSIPADALAGARVVVTAPRR